MAEQDFKQLGEDVKGREALVPPQSAVPDLGLENLLSGSLSAAENLGSESVSLEEANSVAALKDTEPSNSVALIHSHSTNFLEQIVADNSEQPSESVEDNSALSSKPETRSVFELLAAEKSWDEIIALGDQRIEVGGAEALEARIWWVKAQLEKGGVPLGILVAPLEESLSQLELMTSAQKALALQLLVGFVESFVAQNDFELALSFARRGLELGVLDQAMLMRCLVGEIARVRSIQDRRRALELEERANQLESELKGLQNGSLAARGSKSIAFIKAAESKSSSLGSEFGEKLVPNRSGDFAVPEPVARGRSNSLFFSLLLIFMLGAAAYWGKEFLPGGSSSIFGEPPKLVFKPAPPTSMPPVLEAVRNPSGIDALYYEIDRAKATANSENTANSNPRNLDGITVPGAGDQSSRVGQVPEVKDGLAKLEQPPVERREKETIDTSYPVERQPPPREEREAEGSDRRSPLFDRPDGRMRSDWESSQRPTRGGGEAFAVEEYRDGRWFRVTARTSIMERPSVRAYEVARLETGDRVVAERRVGEWLELRSQSGRPGFVIIHDLQPD